MSAPAFNRAGIPSVCRDNFVCAICERDVDMRWNRWGRDEILPPICLSCERWYSQGKGKPKDGSYRDKREVARGYAIAEALNCEAHNLKCAWSRHATA